MTEESAAGAQLRQTIVMVRWALLITCSYLILFSEDGSGAFGAGPLLIAVFLASNLVVGRLQSERLATREFKIGIAVLDTVLIASSLPVRSRIPPRFGTRGTLTQYWFFPRCRIAPPSATCTWKARTTTTA